MYTLIDLEYKHMTTHTGKCSYVNLNSILVNSGNTFTIGKENK